MRGLSLEELQEQQRLAQEALLAATTNAVNAEAERVRCWNESAEASFALHLAKRKLGHYDER